ncbi:MAG: hypothetical protein L6Q99_06865 [Planctomycetes bacterium]|nr:hypothetical protein [Planctomycetota bacterium]
MPTKRELAARRRPHDEAEPPFGASDWPFEGCPIDPNVDGARREAAVERHSGCVRVRLIGSFEPRVSLHFDFRPTRLTRGAAGELFVAGRTTDGRACIELLRFPTAAHDGVVALEPNARVRVLTEPVGGGREVRWFRASEASNGARLLFQFVDADTVEELDVVTGTRRVRARSSLVKRGLVLRGVVDRMGGGVWHVLQSAVATPPDRISVLLLIDENRDGAIDDACEVTAGAARFAGVELHLSDGEPIGQY